MSNIQENTAIPNPSTGIKQPVASKISEKAPHMLLSVIIALGIVYGDIGTSPLYVMRAITHNRVIDEFLIYV